MKLEHKYLKSFFLLCILVTIFTTLSIHIKYMELFKNFIHQRRMKYILLWTERFSEPFVNMEEGREGFLTRNCSFTNCYVTFNKTLLGDDYTLFDVIAFNGPDLLSHYNTLPKERSPHQKYVFASVESPHNYRLCSEKYNNFFNWTWTYKLDSDVRWGFMVIRDTNNKIIGPNKVMHWLNITEMKPVSEELKVKLRGKKHVAAWIVSNCESKSKRELLINELQFELAQIDSLYLIHIYGDCGQHHCSEEDCYESVNNYYFYMAFEDSFSEDYITEQVLIGLQNNAVPIVFGGANYTMYMPDGIYLNAMKLKPKQLARQMHELVVNRTKYEEYFKWKNHYSYHMTEDSVETNEYCLFCKSLNDKELVGKKTVVEDFVSWWNLAGICLNHDQ